MSLTEKPRKAPWTLWLALLGSLLGSIIILLFIRKRNAPHLDNPNASQLDLSQYKGLSKEEAAKGRRTDFEPFIEKRHVELRRAIVRRNVISIFNLSLVGLAIAQLSLQDPLGALITFGTLLLNIGINSFQEMRSIRRVSSLRNQTKPLTTAIRDGQLVGISNEDIVLGDVLLVGKGAEFPAKGHLLGCSDLRIFDSASSLPKMLNAGAIISAGSQCLEGWGVYHVQELPILTSEGQLVETQSTDFGMQMTPIQRVIDRLLKIMLGIVILFLVVLIGYIFINVTLLAVTLDEIINTVLTAMNLPSSAIPPTSDVADIVFRWLRTIVGLIFSLAPTGLFFMIVVAYAVGVADMGQLGAFVRRSYTVESLAQVTVLCISKGASLTGADVQMDVVPREDGVPALPVNHIKQALGCFARSQRNQDFFLRAIADIFDGEIRKPPREFYYLQTFGWGGLIFSDPDLAGTFILGHPEILGPNLEAPEDSLEKGHGDENNGIVERLSAPLKQTFSSLRDVFNKTKSENEHGDESSQQIQPDELEDRSITSEYKDENELELPNRSNQFFNRIRTLFKRDKPSDVEDGISAEQVEPAQVELLFAYKPTQDEFIGNDGNPVLPRGLIPLCKLLFVEQMRPEARQVINNYREAGVNVKILAHDDMERVKQLGIQLGWDVEEASKVISGNQLSKMTEYEISEEIRAVDLYCELDSFQKERLVHNLRDQGEFVAFVGDRADDELAINQAHVRISSLLSFRSVLQRSDIIMLKDSIEALSAVFKKGQRIVNGLMNVLNINLAQVLYVLLLLLVFFASPPSPFYYDPSQGGMIVFFTLVLPNIGLTLWAPKGAAPRDRVARRIARFVVPAAFTMASAALVVFNTTLANGWSMITTQLAVTHTLVGMGLVLVLFAQPPTPLWAGVNRLSGDRRITIMVVSIFILWAVLISIPLAWDLLRVRWLGSMWLNGLVGLNLVIWTFVLRALLRFRWLDKLFGLSE